jgi:myo-inositol-1(or 4)-monophosphatase
MTFDDKTRSPDPTPASLRLLAEKLAVDAGHLALVGRQTLPDGNNVAFETKSSDTDPVTEFDKAAEKLLVDAIRRARPNDTIVGEEGADHIGSSGLEWHLDPIDGTTNYIYNLSAWCTSVAVVDQDGPLAGAVSAPVAGELFSAALGEGATLNSRPIQCSSIGNISTALIGTGFSYIEERREAQAKRAARLLPKVRDIRRLGSAAYDLCMVACGRLDGYYEEHLNSWDYAAGVLIASEAGATTSDCDGGRPNPEITIASAPGVHDELLSLVCRSDI